MRVTSIVALVLLGVVAVQSTVFFSEHFADGEGWTQRWVQSTAKLSEKPRGTLKVSSGKFYNDKNEDAGLQTTQDARFYIISAALKEFATSGSKLPLFVQFTVKHEQNIDCGGGYLKLIPAGSFKSQEDFDPESNYKCVFFSFFSFFFFLFA